ncbi:stress response NST1-like isoform X1 [Labeo rohita]|uniref:Stress response NST1-like isoform X1 n=1 Tax=Labeo rohita TaxID=84645 RepID=A0A498LJF2_LABRO|nr:stress response NST1-like isoform X1 [Labeo rohita]
MAQQCAAQELAPVENLPEAPLMKAGESKAFNFNAMYRKCRKRHRQVKKEREKNEGGSHKDKAEKDTLSLEKIKERGHVAQKKRESAKFREMQSLENLMKGESEQKEAGEKKRKKRKLKERKATEPDPLLVEEQTPVRPPVRSSFLKPIAEHSVLPSVSEHLILPATCFKPLPPVTKPATRPQKPAPAPEEVTLSGTPLQVDPPSVPEHFALSAARFKALLPVTKSAMRPQKPAPAPEEVTMPGTPVQVSPPKQLAVPPSPTPAPDEAVALQLSSTKVCPSSLVKPQPSTSSLFEPPPQLMLIDIEDEENEYVEYTGKTLQACDLLKSERPRILETEINPRMPAWLESDSEVLEEVWASEVVEVLGFGEQKDAPDEMGDSKTIEGNLDEASQKNKEMDEHMKKLFCVASPEGPKNETLHHVNVQEEPKSKRKVPLFLFTWAEEKAKKKEEKKIRKEKEQRDKELLLERYSNDPKLKHLLINKHNHHYRSTE